MRLFKRSLLLLPLLGLAVILIGLPAVAFGQDDNNTNGRFSTRLTGFNEVPSNNTAGTASLRLTLTSASINFELTYSNLSGPPTMSHIHLGQARTNGGVMVFFCGGGGKPACPSTPSGTVTGTIVAADVVALTAQGINAGDLAAVERAIRGGAAYANIHSANFPAGEIRGQIGRPDNKFDD